ncbi:hypothetical protein [Dyella amyloliquefaciens]|uniref:hypothetical protein n=1 Tax=Dyella amyloliquefaciens TaxID=1770545 RepID=UPI00102E987A|nr:hypothetical protein [Dyella amyloliquefaciens]
MNRAARFGMIFAVVSGFLSSTASEATPHSHAYRLSFPRLALQPDEQIESFRVVIPCGHIESIVGIPLDWNIEVTRAVSEVEELRASAGHGASYVRQMDEFNGVINIVSTSDACFSVSSEITVVFDDERVIKLSRKELALDQSGT